VDSRLLLPARSRGLSRRFPPLGLGARVVGPAGRNRLDGGLASLFHGHRLGASFTECLRARSSCGRTAGGFAATAPDFAEKLDDVRRQLASARRPLRRKHGSNLARFTVKR